MLKIQCASVSNRNWDMRCTLTWWLAYTNENSQPIIYQVPVLIIDKKGIIIWQTLNMIEEILIALVLLLSKVVSLRSLYWSLASPPWRIPKSLYRWISLGYKGCCHTSNPSYPDTIVVRGHIQQNEIAKAYRLGKHPCQFQSYNDWTDFRLADVFEYVRIDCFEACIIV